MKKNKLTIAVAAGIAGVTGMANANMYVNPEGTGEVLIYPFYTVNNDLNTAYSVVNTTADTKAVKVRFLEGDNTVEVLDFNVYLSAFDVWTGVLVPSVSTTNYSVANHVGELTATHISSDTSCAPALNKAGQEFLPFAIDASQGRFGFPNNDMVRSRDGHIEILEMATFDGGTVAAADHGSTGTPANCAAIDADWRDNQTYDTLADEAPVSGGLFGSATIVNVAEGLAMTYDAIAIDSFWVDGQTGHSFPGSLDPSIADGRTSAAVFYDGVTQVSDFNTGAEAVSALFTRQNIYNEYALDAIVAGKSEWVVTFPTKRNHVDRLTAIPPFVNTWDGEQACHEFDLTVIDREEQIEVITELDVSPLPPEGANPSLCQEVNVIEFHLPGVPDTAASSILGSTNLINVTTPGNAVTEAGWANLGLLGDAGTTYVTDAISGPNYLGLPVVGFAANQFTNAGAGAGLLAQYAGLFVHKGNVVSAN